MENAWVAVGVAPVYGSRSRGALLADELLCGMEATILERYEDGFCRIKSFYGYGGYTKISCLTVNEAGDTGAAFLGCGTKLIVTGSYVNLQQEPTVKSSALTALPRGSLVWAEGPSMEGWQPVVLAGERRGYLPTVHLSTYPLGEGFGPDALGQSLCRHAISYLGSCYRWGGKTPLGLDCSGLCSQVYLNHGIIIYRDAAIREGYAVQELPGGREQPLALLEPADLLYFRGHMALYLGEGRYIHSAASAGGVTVNSLIPGDSAYRQDLAQSLLHCARLAGCPRGQGAAALGLTGTSRTFTNPL